MFKKKFRISSERLREIFSQKTKSVSADLFFVKLVDNSISNDRYAIIVPKKICKSAVRRHFVKRKIIQSMKKNINNKKSGQIKKDYVITLRRDIGDDTRQLDEQLAKFFG